MRSNSSCERSLASPRRSTKLGVALAFSTAFLVLWLAQHSSQASLQQTTRKSTPTKSLKETALGLNHFTAHCASCHGESGKADTEKGKTLGAADLTAQKVQSRSDSQLFAIISKG